jgi:hypothetical protein
MKTYREGERFPGEIGRTWEDSDPAFPMPPSAPEDAPNVRCVVVDDIGFGGRLFVGDQQVAEGEIARTCTVGYSMDETFDIGWDKGALVTDEYDTNAKFTGTVLTSTRNPTSTPTTTPTSPAIRRTPPRP